MIHIVTGKIHQGKTTALIDIYKKNVRGDGFVSVKCVKDNQIIGYDIMQLSSKKTYPFIVKKDYVPDDWEERFTFGPYCFSKATLSIIEKKIELMLKKGTSPIFLDEIGKVELEDFCFDSILKKILIQNAEMYIAVRDTNVEAVISKYSIKNVNIIAI